MINEFRQALTDHSILRTIGQEIANGMAQSGNSSAFSSFNPAGQSRGNAGGRGTTGDRDDSRKAQLDEIKARQTHSKYTNQLIKSFEKLNKELITGEKDLEASRRKIVAYASVLDDAWGKTMEKVFTSKRAEDKLIKRLNSRLEENVSSMGDVLKIRERQQILADRIAKGEGVISQHTIDAHNKYTIALSEASEGLDSFGESTVKNLKAGTRAFFTYESALLQLTRATKMLYQDYKTQLKQGSRFGDVFSQQWEALKAGMDPGTMSELMGETRQAGMTFGSLNEYMEVTKGQQEKYYNQIGDLTESMRFGQVMFTTLGKAGIKPTAAAMDSLGSTFRVLNKIAGTTSEQFTQMMEQVVADEDVQNRLRTAKASERQGIIAGIAQQIKMNVAMGLTAEQAQGAALAMGKIAGGGAKERYKRAAMMQMAFGAMGVEGGAEAADMVRRGKNRLSSTELTRLEELGTNFTAAATAAQSGNIPGEFVRDTILEKGNLESFFGSTSPLNKQLADGLKANKDVLEDILQAIKDGPSGFEKVMMNVDRATGAIANNGLVQGLLGTASLGGAMYGTGALAARAGAGGLGTGLKAGGKFLGKTAGVAGSVVMAGKDLYDLSQGDTSKANTGALIGSGAGALIGGAVGSFVPVIGTAIGAALGSGLGNMIGEGIGGWLDNKDDAGSVTDNTADLLDPTRRTANATEELVYETRRRNELADQANKLDSKRLASETADRRLAAMRETVQYQPSLD